MRQVAKNLLSRALLSVFGIPVSPVACQKEFTSQAHINFLADT